MAEHTPLPWHLAYLDKNAQRVIKAEHIEIATCWHHSVGSIEKEMEANAALIVRAVNSHDALAKALQDARAFLATANTYGDVRNAMAPAISRIDAALASAHSQEG